MSRIASSPVEVPKGVEVSLKGREIAVKGGNGNLQMQIHESVEIKQEDNTLTFAARGNAKAALAMTGHDQIAGQQHGCRCDSGV